MNLGLIRRAWNKFWFEPISPVPIALFRIIYGLLALQTLYHFSMEFWLLYGGHSILTTDEIATVWWQFDPHFDPLALLPHREWCYWAYFGTICVSSVLLSFGLFTRYAAFYLFSGLCALQTHFPFNYNAGDRYLLIVSFLLMFSNAGDALSIDNLIKRRQEDWRTADGEPVMKPGWVQRMLQVELAVAYCHTSLSKLAGQQWLDGSSIYLCTRFADFRRFPVPFIFDSASGCTLVAWLTLLTEFALWTLIWIKELRYWVLLAGLIMHVFIEWSMNIPVFEGLFVATYILFIDPKDLRACMRRINAAIERKFGPAALVSYDGTCLFCVRSIGILRRLDVFRRLELRDAQTLANEGMFDEIAKERSDREVLVKKKNGWIGGFEAFRWMAQSLPLLWLLCPLLCLPGASLVGDAMYKWIAARRYSFFGPACVAGQPCSSDKVAP